jgi:ElaB/YqjD/DUF883 family membrane-anchored ribosome-binding protein
MFSSKPVAPPSSPNGLTDRALQAADQAILGTGAAASAAIDHLAVGVHHLQDQASDAVEQAASRAESLMHEGTQALRQGSRLLRDSARSASTQTQDYIEREPLKAVLIAAASGAALVALWSLLARSGSRR